MDLLYISEFLKNSIRYSSKLYHNLIKRVFDWQLVEAVLKQTQNISENTNPIKRQRDELKSSCMNLINTFCQRNSIIPISESGPPVINNQVVKVRKV